jgi:hypothetical protein
MPFSGQARHIEKSNARHQAYQLTPLDELRYPAAALIHPGIIQSSS